MRKVASPVKKVSSPVKKFNSSPVKKFNSSPVKKVASPAKMKVSSKVVFSPNKAEPRIGALAMTIQQRLKQHEKNWQSNDINTKIQVGRVYGNNLWDNS